MKDTDQGTEKYEGNRSAIRKYLEHHNVSSSEIEKKLAEERNDDGHHNNEESVSIPDVAEIVLHNLCLDFQRMWKDEDSQMIGADFSQNERSQFLIKIHNIKIVDCCTNNECITVFDSMSEKIFFDLCIRTRGPSNTDLIRVDLIDLYLAYDDGKAEKIVVNTGEEFVWRVLDMTSRIMSATAELAGVDLDLKWDDDAGKFSVTISDPRIDGADEIDSGAFLCLEMSQYQQMFVY